MKSLLKLISQISILNQRGLNERKEGVGGGVSGMRLNEGGLRG